MSLHDLQEGIGDTGKLGEGFIGFGIFGAIGGALLLGLMFGGVFAPGIAGDAVEIDALQVGALFVVMGVGFTVFGVMIVMAGWARHHPGFDEHGAHPTEAQSEDE